MNGDDQGPHNHSPKSTAFSPNTHAQTLPPPPELWPQSPLLFRATPNSNTKIRGVRHASSSDYLLPSSGYEFGCDGALPINNGLESRGRSLVVDFETDLFVGTAMIRLQSSSPLLKSSIHSEDKFTGAATDDEKNGGYFHDKEWTYQVIIKGRFTRDDIPMSECITGQILDRPGILPSWWLLQSALSVFRYFAPQLQANFDGDSPRFLCPLVGTAQHVAGRTLEEDGGEHGVASYQAGESMEMETDETTDKSSLLLELENGDDLLSSLEAMSEDEHIQLRKDEFNNLYKSEAATPTFRCDREYTFEFFQHLIAFEDLSIDLGRVGRYPLAGMLDGQPLKVLAAHQNKENDTFNYLWSFDIWHESLYADAEMHYQRSPKA